MPKIWLLPVRCAIAVPNGRESGTSYRYSVLQWWKSHSSLYIHAKTPHPQREYIYGPARWLRGWMGVVWWDYTGRDRGLVRLLASASRDVVCGGMLSRGDGEGTAAADIMKTTW